MAKTAYILIFDRDDNRDYSKLHNSLVQLPEVTNWFHYVKSSYILISSITNASILNEKILPIMNKKRYLLMELNLKNRNGFLPKEGWEWLNKHANS